MFPDAGGGAGKQVGIWESDGVRKRAGVTGMEGERVREQMARGRKTDREIGGQGGKAGKNGIATPINLLQVPTCIL